MAAATISATTALAVYGAVISTLIAIWQIASWLLQRRTRIEVKTYLGEIAQAGMPTIHDLVMLVAINKSEHEVNWTNGSWCLQGGGTRRVMPGTFPYGDPLPMVIPARDSKTMIANASVLEQIDFTRPVVAVVTLSTGKEFKSKPTVLRATR